VIHSAKDFGAIFFFQLKNKLETQNFVSKKWVSGFGIAASFHHFFLCTTDFVGQSLLRLCRTECLSKMCTMFGQHVYDVAPTFKPFLQSPQTTKPKHQCSLVVLVAD
jgi:hypothetical protein